MSMQGLSETARAYAEAVRTDFAATPPARRSAGEPDIATEVAELFRRLASHDWLGCVVTEADGGNGRGLAAMAAATEAMASTGHMELFPGLTALSTYALAHHGSETLRRELLPEILAGRCKFAVAATEEGAGFNTFRIQTFARREGDSYVINGTKIYTSGADVADKLLLVARTIAFEDLKTHGLPKTAGLSIFVVDAQDPAIRRHYMATRGEGRMRQYALEIEDLRVPADAMLGAEHEGARALFPAFNIERILFVHLALGASQFCLDTACAYANERRVFADVPVGQYQAVQHPLADARIRQEAVRRMAREAAQAFDAGTDPAKVMPLANAAKYLASELGLKAVDAAMEAMGGRGFDEDYGVIQLWETMRLLKLSPVSNNLILNEVAERQLGLPRSY